MYYKFIGYKYGMRQNVLCLGCFPLMGFLYRADDVTGKYYGILVYCRPLNDHEQDYYELDYLGEV